MKIWTFKELLTWKIPEYLSANNQGGIGNKPYNIFQNRMQSRGGNYDVPISHVVNLYKMDIIT